MCAPCLFAHGNFLPRFHPLLCGTQATFFYPRSPLTSEFVVLNVLRARPPAAPVCRLSAVFSHFCRRLRPSPLAPLLSLKKIQFRPKNVRWFLGLLLLRRFMANIRFAFEAEAAAAAAGQPSALLARNARTHAHGDLAINFPAAMTMPDPAPSIYDVRKF